MNIDKLPLVTTLLRAARSQDDDTLRHTLENILRNGIGETELNAQDCSGRVSDDRLKQKFQSCFFLRACVCVLFTQIYNCSLIV